MTRVTLGNEAKKFPHPQKWGRKMEPGPRASRKDDILLME